jgi:hypothetical protein
MPYKPTVTASSLWVLVGFMQVQLENNQALALCLFFSPSGFSVQIYSKSGFTFPGELLLPASLFFCHGADRSLIYQRYNLSQYWLQKEERFYGESDDAIYSWSWDVLAFSCIPTISQHADKADELGRPVKDLTQVNLRSTICRNMCWNNCWHT